jgi:hypothetical protein
MSPTELTSDYETTFCDQVEKGLPAIRTSIRQYRMHADLTRVLSECSYVVKKVFLYTGYLLGHLWRVDESGCILPSQEAGAPALCVARSRTSGQRRARNVRQYPDDTRHSSKHR